MENARQLTRKELAKLITDLESTTEAVVQAARSTLAAVWNPKADTWRIGITGPPGAGKSTLIEQLGLLAIENKHKVGVLAVDPSSPISKGSILGDKTRMPKLSSCEQAFVRPTPSGGILGGLGPATFETMLAVESAGFDVVFVESVGVGQSEADVTRICDFSIQVIAPGVGDDLQLTKRGLADLVDLIVINKHDGPQKGDAARLANEVAMVQSLRQYPAKAILISGATGVGIDQVFEDISSRVNRTRRQPALEFYLFRTATAAFATMVAGSQIISDLAQDASTGNLLPWDAANEILDRYVVAP